MAVFHIRCYAIKTMPDYSRRSFQFNYHMLNIKTNRKQANAWL